MRIAQVAPLYESVPPKLYGGTERVVSYLTEGLVNCGHEVTLFASGDSRTQARLISTRARALRLDTDWQDPLGYHLCLLDDVFRRRDEFDLIHFHLDYLHFPLSRLCSTAHLTTLHGRLDIPDLVPLYRRFSEEPLVSISDSQREPLRWANWMGTVYHGLPEDLYQFQPKPGNYLAFVGRISFEKRLDRAIEIARRCQMPIKIGAKVDPADRAYFENQIRPLLDAPGVEFLGEVDEVAKNDLLGNAAALLFPIDWPEPFGLVVIESLACGTPVIGFDCGSVPELIDDGETGFICQSIEQAVAAVGSLGQIDRRRCRSTFERRFASTMMVDAYQQVYDQLIRGKEVLPFKHGGNHSGSRPALYTGDFVASGRTQPSA